MRGPKITASEIDTALRRFEATAVPDGLHERSRLAEEKRRMVLACIREGVGGHRLISRTTGFHHESVKRAQKKLAAQGKIELIGPAGHQHYEVVE